jgi:hypothetical protein
LQTLQEAVQPQLVEILWAGEPVDMITETAIVAAGFLANYPIDSEHRQTQKVAENWHADGAEGVLCRSASLSRFGFADWTGDHARWSELSIYIDNASRKPSLLMRRDDFDWLAP